MPIRPAISADIPGIAAIWNPVIRDTTVTFTTEQKTPQALARLIQNHTVLVSIRAQLDGFACLTPFRAGPGYAQTRELSLYLAPAAQRQGLGAALLCALEVQARTAQIHTLIAGIAGQNAPAIAFHTAMGYAHCGQLRDVGFKHGAWHDLILMQKIL